MEVREREEESAEARRRARKPRGKQGQRREARRSGYLDGGDVYDSLRTVSEAWEEKVSKVLKKARREGNDAKGTNVVQPVDDLPHLDLEEPKICVNGVPGEESDSLRKEQSGGTASDEHEREKPGDAPSLGRVL